MVVLYSRLNNLASIFTFHYSTATGKAISKCDPYLLPLRSSNVLFQGFGPSPAVTQPIEGLLGLRMICIPFGKTVPLSELQEIYDKDAQLYQLSILHRDLVLSERLYVGWKGTIALRLDAPDTYTRRGIFKTPAEVQDDFMVPDGVADEQLGEFTLTLVNDSQQEHMQTGTESLAEDRWTMEMKWLVEAISGHLPAENGHLKALPFDNYLKYVYTAIEDKLKFSRPGIDTISELKIAEADVTDVDDAATALAQLLEKITLAPPDAADNDEKVSQGCIDSTMSLPQAICDTMGFNHGMHLSQIYGSLVRFYVGFLPHTPSRVRVAIEKQLRNIAAQICLAAHTIRIHTEPVQEEEPQMLPQDLTFALPVRRKGSTASLKGKERASSSSTPPQSSSSSLTGAPSIHTLPTPEPPTSSHRSARSGTPSAQSTRSVSSFQTATTTDEFHEDPSSRRLRALTALTPQPALPPKLSNILTHWNLGTDPDTYDWDAAQHATALPGSAAIAAEEARREKATRRAKKRARNSTLMEEGEKAYRKNVDVGERATESQLELRRSTRVEARSQVPAVSTQVPESSQTGVGVSSQPVGGKFGGGKKGLKAKRGRRKGF